MRSGKWLLEPGEDPARNLADKISRMHGLAVPIDIFGLLESYADVERHAWPYEECDAVVINLLSSRPTVFLRRSQYRRRNRFTAAHELGHIVMAWHIGTMSCTPDEAQLGVEALQPARTAADVRAAWRIRELEAEASRFGSYLLMPDRELRAALANEAMDDALNYLNEADVSAAAAVMRLREILLPGFAFLIPGDRDDLYTSSGTEYSGREFAELQAQSYDSGHVVVGGRRVNWFRLADFQDFEPTSEARRSSDILRDVVAAVEPDETNQESLFRSVNGKTAGSLSKKRANTLTQAFAIVRHKFYDVPDFEHLCGQADFELYLRRKTEEWGAKRDLQ